MSNTILKKLYSENIINKDIENLLYKHLDSVIEINKNLNLTRITNKNDAILLHIEDSLVPIHYILCNFNKNNTNYADLGSGAGYPGIPIASICGFNSSLIETTTKKANALKDMISLLGLNNINVINSRIEEVAKNELKFDLLTARALSSLSSLLELASPICKIGGQLVCYKSTNCDEEIKEAKTIENIFGFKKEFCEDYVLSDNNTKRRIIAYKKINEASIKLPRKYGIAQKRPYKI